MSTPPRFPREIAPELFWLSGCKKYPDPVIHAHLSCYLVAGSSYTALVDTSSPLVWPQVDEQLTEALAGRPLDYIVPTHPELQHMGSLPRLLERYPHARVVGDLRDYHVHYPEHVGRLDHRVRGDSIDLGGRELILVDAALKDLPNTLWVYDTLAQALFVSDGFAYIHHRDGDCALMSSELAALPSFEDVELVTAIIYHWVRYVDADLYFEKLVELFARYPVRMVAPAHSNVVTDVESIAAIIRESMLGERVPAGVET